MTQAQSEKKRILIADDVHETRRNTRVMVSMIEGLEVVAIATDGVQAVQMAREAKPDIILMDINMPRLNGLAAFKRIAQEDPNIACIIISAEKDPSAFRAAMSIGIRHYLIKPFTADELEKAITEVSQQFDKKQVHISKTDRLLEKNDTYLKQLADEFTRTKRTDDKAIEVFEEVLKLPNCELRWMQTLAMIYVIRQKWASLKLLAEKIEQLTRPS